MKRYNDQQIDRALGVILRTGVIAAALLVAAGGLFYLAHPNAAPESLRVFHGAPAELTHVHSIVRGALAFEPLFVIQLGLIVLIATPVVRVIACAAGFGLLRDWTYVAISFIVLALLMVGLLGHGG